MMDWLDAMHHTVLTNGMRFEDEENARKELYRLCTLVLYANWMREKG